MQQLFRDVPGSDRMTYDQMSDITTACVRLTSRAEVGQIVQTKEAVSQIADDRTDLGGKPGPLEIATAICAASFDYSPLRVPTVAQEMKSLCPLPKGARIFGG